MKSAGVNTMKRIGNPVRKEAYDLVMGLLEAYWKAAEYFGNDPDEDSILTEAQKWVMCNYWPTDPQEAAEWEASEALFLRALEKAQLG